MPEWYTDFFSPMLLAGRRASGTTSAEVDFIARMASLRAGSRVLDVPCGSGRHTLELARRGCRVTGMDVSAEAIGYLRRAAADQRLDVNTTPRRHAASATGDLTADAAICMGNAFGFLDHRGTERLLADLARVFAPTGTLVLDYGFVAESLLPDLALAEEPMRFGGIDAHSVNAYDTENSRLLTAFTFRRGGEEHRGTSVQHVYTAAEGARLMIAAGFSTLERYGGTDGSPYRLRSPRLLLVARS